MLLPFDDYKPFHSTTMSDDMESFVVQTGRRYEILAGGCVQKIRYVALTSKTPPPPPTPTTGPRWPEALGRRVKG